MDERPRTSTQGEDLLVTLADGFGESVSVPLSTVILDFDESGDILGVEVLSVRYDARLAGVYPLQIPPTTSLTYDEQADAMYCYLKPRPIRSRKQRQVAASMRVRWDKLVAIVIHGIA